MIMMMKMKTLICITLQIQDSILSASLYLKIEYVNFTDLYMYRLLHNHKGHCSFYSISYYRSKLTDTYIGLKMLSLYLYTLISG